MTIASAIPAAVVSMAVLRVLGGGGMLENNIVQTGASAGSSIASGVIFTIPALVILGFWQDSEYAWVLTIARVSAASSACCFRCRYAARSWWNRNSRFPGRPSGRRSAQDR
jgi:putative OPT family oligopeptide transporter